MISEFFKKLPAFYGITLLIAEFIMAFCWCLSQDRWILPMPLYPIQDMF
jgi:hypothetical protein